MANDQLADTFPLIDVHIHLHPPRLFAAIRRWFAERSSWVIEHPTGPAAVAQALRAAGVTRFVFCSYAHKSGMARELNAWLAQTARDLGGYGLPLATVHLDDPDPLRDLVAAMDDGCIGLKIHEDVQRLAVDDPRFDALYAQIIERGGFVLAHVGPIPWASDTNDGPARIAALMARHPRLRLVIAHFGVPDSHRYAPLLARYPTLFLDTTMAFTKGNELYAGVDAAFIESIADSIVFGSDYPNTPHPYAADIAGLEELGVSAVAMQRIVSGNALRLLSS